jgi:hypothetical protein
MPPLSIAKWTRSRRGRVHGFGVQTVRSLSSPLSLIPSLAFSPLSPLSSPVSPLSLIPSPLYPLSPLSPLSLIPSLPYPLSPLSP